MKEAGIRLLLSMMEEANDMVKEFRVNMVRSGRPDGLVLLLRALSLKSAVKKLRYSSSFQLPAAQYYVYETGRYLNGVSITLTPAFVAHLRISKREAEIVNGYLQAKTVEQFQNEDHPISHTVIFPDGKQMDIKCCGAQSERSWTEAVLFDENGCEICHSKVLDRYDIIWELEYQSRRYVTIVRVHQ